MSTETQMELERIQQSVASAYAALAALGADMPENQNTDNLAKTAGTVKAVLYSPQTPTEAQKAQARENIGIDYSIPDFWQSALNTAIATVKSLQTGKNCVTFVHFSDNHVRLGYSGVLIAEAMKKCHIPFCFYNGDSISSGYIATEDEMIAQEEAFENMISAIPDDQFCRSLGNHDGYWAVSASEKHTYTRAQNYELFMRKRATAQNKQFGDDGTYFFVEDLASKVRFIVLNTNGGSVDDTQLAWFRDIAMKVDEGWAVVVFSHQPISNHYHSGISNAAAVRAIVTDSDVEIIGWFSGHIHRDRIYTGAAVNTTDDSEGADMGFTQVTITSDYTEIAYDSATQHSTKEDNKSHAIDFVTINRDTKAVNLTRLGIGNSRSYRYVAAPEAAYTDLTKQDGWTWTENHRTNSSGGFTAADGTHGADYIAVKFGDIIRIKGLTLTNSIQFFTESKTLSADGTATITLLTSNGVVSVDGDVTTLKAATTNGTTAANNVHYQRFCGTLMTGYTLNDVIITKNEPIV